MLQHTKTTRKGTGIIQMIEHKEHFHGSDLEKIEKIYGISKENIINFAANVNPLGESDKLKDALYKRIDAITQYPDREYTSLRKAIAKYCQCDYNDVVVGNGCTELISLFIQVTSPKQTLLIVPTYSEYERDLKLNGSKVCYFNLEENDDFRINTDNFLKNITPETDLIIICNPNNPTAGIIFPDELRTILTHCKNTNTYVMIDETYIEFSTNVDEISAISLCHEFDNLIVLRGTSKFFATPGLRLGYAVTSNAPIKNEINTNKNPWMINSLAVVAGETMFADNEYIEKTRNLILSERNRLSDKLSQSGRYKVYPSHSNFLLLKILDESVTSSYLFDKAIRRNLMIRDCSTFEGFKERFIRICIMNISDNDKLLSCLLE